MTSTCRSQNLLTIGEIARRLGQPLHRVEYIVRARNIRADQRAGSARVFSQAAADRIASELERIDEQGRLPETEAK